MRRIDASAFSGRAADGEQVYPDSVGSSPHSSVGADKISLSEEPLHVRWEEARVKLMCSFGGRILPRPHDNQLRYVGGETRIVVVNRNVMYGELTEKLFKIFGTSLTIKYQLPSEDLDALISVTSDEDLENMMEEYDRLQLSSGRSSRLRLFLFPAQLESQTSLSSLLNSSCNRENWFVDALNGMPVLPRSRSSETSSSIVSEAPDYLFGLDNSVDDWAAASRSAANPSEQFPEKPVVAPVLGSLLQGFSGELPNSAPGSPLKRLPTTLSTSSAPPAMMSILSAAVDALKAGAGDPTNQAGAPQPTRDVGKQQEQAPPVSQENPANQAPVVPQVPRDPVSQGPVIVPQERSREAANPTAVPQVQVPRDANSQGPVLVHQGRGAEKIETPEDSFSPNFTGAPGELNNPGKKDGSNQRPETLLDGAIHKPPTNGSNSSSREQITETLIAQTQKLSPKQPSNPAADVQQQKPLPESMVQAAAAISSQAKQDPQLESVIRVEGKVLLNVGEETQALSAAAAKVTSKATDEQQVLESFRKLKLDDKASNDPRAIQFEKEQSNLETRQTDSTGRPGADASKLVGESRFVQLISKQGVEEGLRLPQSSSPPLPADPFSSTLVPPPLPSQGMMKSSVPIQPGGDMDNTLRSAFYQQQQQFPLDEPVQASSRYATQGPAIKLPIMPTPTSAPVAPLFARSDSSRTSAGNPPPTVALAHPQQQQQLLRQLQPTGAPPQTAGNAGPPTPVTVYPSTSLQVEGVPMRGTTGIPVQSPFTQFQRQVINDPNSQFQRPSNVYRDYLPPVTHTGPPVAALPSRFRPVVTSQPGQFDAKGTVGLRPPTAMPSRPSASPAQLYNYYNVDQLNAYAAAGGAVLYDPVNATYIVGPNNAGVLPVIAPLASANPFVDDASGMGSTYQEVHDVPLNPQLAPGVAVAGENRIPGRQFVMRN